jgi:hypothetical protein
MRLIYDRAKMRTDSGHISNTILPAAHLNLATNKFTDVLPTEIGNFGNIAILNLASNRFLGPLPAELGLLGTLRKSSLCFLPGACAMMGPNMYSSTVPAGELYLDDNFLSGAVPAALAGLTNIGKLS